MHTELLSEKERIGEFEITSISRMLRYERDKYRASPEIYFGIKRFVLLIKFYRGDENKGGGIELGKICVFEEFSCKYCGARSSEGSWRR